MPLVQNLSGLQLIVDELNSSPTLRVVLPGRPVSDRAIEILFPEHVTIRKAGATNVEHLYLWRPGSQGKRPNWDQPFIAIVSTRGQTGTRIPSTNYRSYAPYNAGNGLIANAHHDSPFGF